VEEYKHAVPKVIPLSIMPHFKTSVDLNTVITYKVELSNTIKNVKREQVKLSCLRCRQLKKRCDNMKPCMRCIDAGLCENAPARRKPQKGTKAVVGTETEKEVESKREGEGEGGLYLLATVAASLV
jgi:hypothetical protein